MRIFLLPLTTRQALIYCQKITQKPAAQLSIVDRVTKRAADTWAKWEAAEKGWQKSLVKYGNRAFQRIPYQEWGLKSFPPSNPTIQAEAITAEKKYDVLYRGNIIKKDDVPKIMSRLARERKTLHWNRFVGSMMGLPFTIPFALVPVVPNIPFFYLAYRCWSHWRALKGSDHLDFILDHRMVHIKSSPELETLYDKVAPGMHDSFAFVTAEQVEEGSDPEEKALLQASSHVEVAEFTGVPELSGEIERAMWQVEQKRKKEQDSAQAQKQNKALSKSENPAAVTKEKSP